MNKLLPNRLHIFLVLILLAGGLAYSQSAPPGYVRLIEQYNRPVNADQFLIRPGETLRVSFVGTQLTDLSLSVDAEGRIVHREIGLHLVSGMSLAQVRVELEKALVPLYPNSRIVFSIGNPRLVSVEIRGWVKNPGRYSAFTSQTVADIIDSAGGLTGRASRRGIKFIGGPRELTVDLDKAAFLGEYESNPNLYAGFSIIVPEKSGNVVSVVGQVRIPKEIEFLEGDSLGSLIAMAGGITRDADYASAYVLGDSLRDLQLRGNIHGGDIIVVPERASEKQMVLIQGAVVRPGKIPFDDGMTLAALLSASGGINPEANRGRITIFRRAEIGLLTPFSSERYPISSSGSADMLLKAADSVVVPSLVGFVRVSGRVGRPGLYPYSHGKAVSHYILAAGGKVSDLKNMGLILYDRVSRISFAVGNGAIPLDGDEIIVIDNDEDR